MRLKLISMPVAEPGRPSIGLTQLASVVRTAHPDRVAVEVLYLNHDFASFMNEGSAPNAPDLHHVLLAHEHHGLAEWFFRQEAFPETTDNTVEYFRRYFPGKTAPAWRAPLLARRRELRGFFDDVIEQHGLLEADVVGFSTMFSQNVASFALARRLKERNPEITIALGGPNCETPMGEEIARHVEWVDYVFSGPALISFPAFVGLYLEGRTGEASAVRGVFSAAEPEREPAERIGEELDINVDIELDYSDYFASFERHFPMPERPPIVMFETSRGCWWGERSHCTFCGLNGLGMKYRAMRADKAISLIQSLFTRYRSKSSYFMAVDNIMPIEYPKEVLPFLEPPPGTKVFYETKANLKEHHLRVMADAGVTRIHAGIESLATSSLKLMAKGTTSFVNLKLLMNSLKYGIWVRWNLLVGFPGEVDEVYEKYVRDLHRLFHLAPPNGASAIRFDRYSPYFMSASDWGLKLRHFDFYGLVYPFDDAVLSNLAYYFMDTNYNADYTQAAARWIGKLGQEVQHWRDRWTIREDVPPPKLELRGGDGGAVVVDTRGDSRIEVELDEARLRLVEFLDKPRAITAITALGTTEGFDASVALAYLDDHELVWNEGDQFMSIVTERDTAPHDAREAREMATGQVF